MPLHLGWQDIALRLALTLAASGLIGFDRGASGHSAGLRTTILVGLAAALAMIQANLLLAVDGKSSASFSVLDLMRLPLGILTGVGFIGGGAILKRGETVKGLTTAATLWVTTVVALCLGGGQLILGCAGVAATIVTLRVMKGLEDRLSQDHRAKLEIETPSGTPLQSVAASLTPPGYAAHFKTEAAAPDGQAIRYGFEIHWRQPASEGPPLELLNHIRSRYGIVGFEIFGEAAD